MSEAMVNTMRKDMFSLVTKAVMFYLQVFCNVNSKFKYMLYITSKYGKNIAKKKQLCSCLINRKFIKEKKVKKKKNQIQKHALETLWILKSQ